MSIAGTSKGAAVHFNGPRMGLLGCDGSRCGRVWANIRAWQMRNGWNDVAYNHGICPGCGRVHEGRGWGARSGANGTTAGNREWHAWMVMYGDGEPLTDIAKVRLLELAREHRRRFGRSRLTTHRAVRGGTTECPGSEAIEWVADGAPSPTVIEEDDLTPEQDKMLREVHAALDGRNVGLDLRAIRLALRGVLAALGLKTRHDPPGAYDV